jgi:hypothetical protein
MERGTVSVDPGVRYRNRFTFIYFLSLQTLSLQPFQSSRVAKTLALFATVELRYYNLYERDTFLNLGRWKHAKTITCTNLPAAVWIRAVSSSPLPPVSAVAKIKGEVTRIQ